MRDRYFRMYESIKYKECFYLIHNDRASLLYAAYSVVMLAISIISVCIWSISKDMPVLWAIVVAAAQFAQALSGWLPWARQHIALRYLVPELASLSLDIDSDWRAIDVKGYSDKKISELIDAYEARFNALEKQFTSDLKFSEAKGILREAEKKQRAHFYSRYPVPQISERSEEANAR